jgi:hypothetical protein
MHLAQAFDGIAGALYEGHIVPRADLDSAVQAAHGLWRAEGAEAPAQDFKMYRIALLENAAGAARGDPKIMSMVERAAHRLARALRTRAKDAGRLGQVHPELDATITVLDKRYARFAVLPTNTGP